MFEVTEKSIVTPQYVGFYLGRALYGFDKNRLAGVLDWQMPRPLANGPRYLRGVIDVQDQPVLVIDLRERFNIDYEANNLTTNSILLINHSSVQGSRFSTLGLVVDGLASDLSESYSKVRTSGYVSDDFISEVIRFNNQSMLLLNLDRLLKQGLLHLHLGC